MVRKTKGKGKARGKARGKGVLSDLVTAVVSKTKRIGKGGARGKGILSDLVTAVVSKIPIIGGPLAEIGKQIGLGRGRVAKVIRKDQTTAVQQGVGRGRGRGGAIELPGGAFVLPGGQQGLIDPSKFAKKYMETIGGAFILPGGRRGGQRLIGLADPLKYPLSSPIDMSRFIKKGGSPFFLAKN